MDSDPIMDSTIHRVPVVDDRQGKKAGSYVGHLDGIPAGWGQNYKTDAKANWKLNGISLTQAEITKMREEGRRNKEIRMKKRAADAQIALTWLVKKFASGTSGQADNHPYLKSKGLTHAEKEIIIDPHNGSMILPLVNIAARLQSGQRIYPDGAKRNIKNTVKDGAFFIAAPPGKSMMDFFDLPPTTRSLFIAEGYATAATIAAATERFCVAAIDSANMPLVAQTVQKKYPDIPLIIAADDDRFAKPVKRGIQNKGLHYAQESAAKTGGSQIIIPPFKDTENGTDWNDRYQNHGGGAQGLRHIRDEIIALLHAQNRAQTPPTPEIGH